MPMIDAYIPDGALRPDAEAALMNRLTEIVTGYEGFDPASPVVRSRSWVFLHRPAVYVGGLPAEAPYYKIVPSVPEGQLNEADRAGVIADVTEAILDAEAGAWPREPDRVWVFPTEIPEGHWGGQGKVMPLASIIEMLSGTDMNQARALADKRIAASRTEHSRLP